MKQHAIGEVIWKDTNGCIKILYRLIITNPGNIDPVFGSFKLILEVAEILVCLEVRVSFNDKEKF